MIVDAHCHCHELGNLDDLADVVLAVSDDYDSSVKTVELAEQLSDRVIACVGVHPWEIDHGRVDDVEKVMGLISKRDVIRCVGEVGLDKRFVPRSFGTQLNVFRRFLAVAREYDLVVNVHAPDAWRDVVEELRRADIDRAVIHWYTGPLDLIDEIVDLGYFIGINPAAKIQRKHVEVIRHVPRHAVVTESDAPYEYRGLRLMPSLIRDTLTLISQIWGISVEDVREQIYSNFRRLIR